MFAILFSKTVLFTAIGAAMHVAMNPTPQTWMEAINAVMVAYAARSAIAKGPTVTTTTDTTATGTK